MAVCLCMAITGCISIISTHSSETSKGNCDMLSSGRLAIVTTGETTKTQLLEEFGEPTNARDLGEGVEILRYECKEISKDHFSFLFLINVHSTETEEEAVNFELKDGVVLRYWRD